MADSIFNNVSDGILREIFQSYLLVDEWQQMKVFLQHAVGKFYREQAYDTLSEQVFFSVISKPFRELLGFEDRYEPTMLREPFILRVEREYLEQSIRHSLITEVTAVVLSVRDDSATPSRNYKLQALTEHLLSYYRDKWKGDVFLFAEVLGSTVLRTMNRSEYQIVHDILSPDNAPYLHAPDVALCSVSSKQAIRKGAPGSTRIFDRDTLLSSYHSSQDSMSQVYSLGLTSKEDYIKIFRRIAGVSDEITELLGVYSVPAVDSVCSRIVGSLLPNSMRVAVWAIRFLHRPADKLVETNHYISELSRLGSFHSDSGGLNKCTPISNTAKQYIQTCLERAFPVWLSENNGVDIVSVSGTVLARRAEHLVNALYVLTGIISERGVMVAILLLRVFQTDSPVSEKMLRMYSTVVEDFWPSDHPNTKYSLIYTNNLIWNIIKKEDVELFFHIKEFGGKDPDEGEDIVLPLVQEWNRSFGGIFKHSRKELPMGMALIKGWLDTGFLGWLPEFGVIFIWDQLALLGGTPTQNQRFVARLCAQLLRLLRGPLLESTSMFASVLRKSGRELRSKDVFNLTCEAVIMYTDDIPLEERLENEGSRDREAALSIQRVCRGYLSRLRAKLIRKAKGGDQSRYLDDKGDFHSYQWMRNLSIQTDRSRAYQLQEIKKFNNSAVGRSTLRMANSRSECIIDVYGVSGDEDARPPKGLLLSELSPSSSSHKHVYKSSAAAAAEFLLEDKAGASREVDAISTSVGNVNNDVTSAQDVQSPYANNCQSKTASDEHPAEYSVRSTDTPDVAEESIPRDNIVPFVNGEADSELAFDDNVLAQGRDSEATDKILIDSVSSLVDAAECEIDKDDTGENCSSIDRNVPLANAGNVHAAEGDTDAMPIKTTSDFNNTSKTITTVNLDDADLPLQLKEVIPLDKECSSTIKSADPATSGRLHQGRIDQEADEIFAKSLFEVSPLLRNDTHNPGAIILDEVVVDNNLTLCVDQGGAQARATYSSENSDNIPMPVRCEIDPVVEDILLPLEKKIQDEISGYSLTTLSQISGSFEEAEKFAQPHDDPFDYVSLGSLPHSSPARQSEVSNIDNFEVDDAVPAINPAPALYGFFLEERDDIREYYRRLEEISKSIQNKKHLFEVNYGRFMGPTERADVVADLDEEFARLKTIVEEKAVDLRKKEIILLSKWSKGGPQSKNGALMKGENLDKTQK